MSLNPSVIVADAARLADESGFEAVTLSAVARRLGVRTPSLYAHVRDRDALLDGITALALADLAARISAAVAGRSGRAALDGLATAHRSFAQEAPGRWQALHRRAGETAVRSEGARQVATLTSAVLRGYRLPEDEVVHAVRLLGSTISGFLALERIGNFDHSRPDPATSWRRTIDALDVLLRDWPTT